MLIKLFWILRIYLGIGAGFALLGFIAIGIIRWAYSNEFFRQRLDQSEFGGEESIKFVESLDDWKTSKLCLELVVTYPLVMFYFVVRRFKT